MKKEFDEIMRDIELKFYAGKLNSSQLTVLEYMSEDIKESKDSFAMWMEKSIDVCDRWVTDVYRDYVEFCLLNRLKPLSNVKFSMKVCTVYNVKSKVVSYKGNSKRKYIDNTWRL